MTAFESGLTALRPWPWTVRDPDGIELDGQIDGYANAHVDLLDGDVGQWSLTLPVANLAVGDLLAEGSGVVMRPDGIASVICSGQVDTELTEYDTASQTATFSGPLDEVELAGEVAWPDPPKWLNDATSQNVLSGTTDTRTGVAEDVLLAYIAANIGASAFHSGATTPPIDRRRAYLNIPASLHRGTSGTYSANFDLLLDIAKTICRTGGITWRIVQGAPGQLDLVVRARANVSADVVFSRAEGSVVKSGFTRQRPSVTMGMAVSDDGTNRSYAVAIDTAAESLWRRRFVGYGDGSSAIISDLLQSAGDLIAAGIEKAGASLEAVVLPEAPQFAVDYRLGDIVSVVDATGAVITDVLREMVYDHSPGQGPTLVPSIGYAQTDQESALVPVIRDQAARLRTLERRR